MMKCFIYGRVSIIKKKQKSPQRKQRTQQRKHQTNKQRKWSVFISCSRSRLLSPLLFRVSRSRLRIRFVSSPGSTIRASIITTASTITRASIIREQGKALKPKPQFPLKTHSNHGSRRSGHATSFQKTRNFWKK